MTAPRFLLPAVIVPLLAATHAAGEPLCRPALAVKDVQFSEMHQWRRTWTAQVTVDASPCATTSGRFNMHFVRLKEIGPDLEFTEQFTWTAGQIEASTMFAADESVLEFSIADIAPCPCRK